MTTLLELKEKLTRFYGKYDIYNYAGDKVYCCTHSIFADKSQHWLYGKNQQYTNCLILALICSILPVGGAVFIGSVLILLDMYALSLEVCIVALILFILMYILYFRFSPKNEYGVL